uniref:Metalloendopeptidase n=1 Tax=Plectus sambesii TaxID=2011161 RepID=A0A914VT46_9BILA
MNLQYGLFIFVGSGFVILVASVSDNPKITKTNGEFNPFNDELIKTDIVRHSLLGHGNCRTIKDLEDIRKALQDLSNKNIAGPIVDGEPLETLKRLPRYEAVAGAPEKLSILNINLRDYLFQTDILASAEEIRELTASLESRQKRKATSLPKKRWPFGIVTHEIAHALGFYHEQERYDRDKHVQVVFGNIAPINQLQFQLVKAMNLYGIPYDFGSVMHYEPDAFAINPRIPTIRAKNGEFQQTMGQGRGPSFLDVLEMNRHYKCLDACRKSTTKCLNGGYPNPNNCRVCKCPAGFGGRFCQGLQPSTEGENCGGILNAKYEWQSFSASLGTRVLVDTPTTCYWHIKAPVYTNIQVKITHLRTTCAAGCFYAALELKTDAQFVQSGHTHCCVTDNIHRIYKSKTNLVPVIGYANLALSFTIQYRQGELLLSE